MVTGDWGSVQAHLAELRARLLLVATAWVALWGMGWLAHPQVLDWLVHPWCMPSAPGQLAGQLPVDQARNGCVLVSYSLTGGLSARLWVASLPAVLVGVPIAGWQAYLFALGPPNQPDRVSRALVYRIGWGGLGLWVFSLWLTIILARPVVQTLLALGKPWIIPLITPEGLLSALTGLFVGIVVILLIPALVMLGVYTTVITPAQLVAARPYLVIGLLLVAAVITPTTDPFTMLALAACPLGVIDGICRWYAWRARRESQAWTRAQKVIQHEPQPRTQLPDQPPSPVNGRA